VACGPAAGARHEHRLEWLSDADADHVRELLARAGGGAHAADARDHRGDRRRKCDPAAGTAADLPGRVRLSRLRPPGRAAWSGPIHARGGAGVRRRSLLVRRLAVSALPIRAAVHARQLRDCSARARRGPVGVQGARRREQPRGRRAGRARRRQARPLASHCGGVRRPEPGAARAGRRWRAQRHADHAGARRRARAHGRREPALSRGRGDTRGGRRRQGHSRAGPAVPDASPPPLARTPAGCGRGRRGPARARRDRSARLRLARARLSRRCRRATAAGRRAQRARRDGAAVRAERDARLVARRVRRAVRRSARLRAVAHGARRRLARGRRLDDARAAAVDRLAASLVCDLGAAASRGQRRSAAARRDAAVLRVRDPHPPAARRWAARPRPGEHPQARPGR
jgi:hypothetical protein